MGRVIGAATGQLLQGHLRGLSPLFFHLVVGHGSGFGQVGVFVGFWEREGEEQM
jgi:hypothetical protein